MSEPGGGVGEVAKVVAGGGAGVSGSSRVSASASAGAGAGGVAGAAVAGGVPAEPVDEVLAALADPTRRRLLDLLAARGAASATDLAADLPVTRQAVVKHLAVLDAAGLVTGRRAGREVRYEVRSAALDATARWMATLAADWDRRLARIKAVAEAAEAAEAAETTEAAGRNGL